MIFSTVVVLLIVTFKVYAHGSVRFLSIDGRFYWGYSPERVYDYKDVPRNDRIEGNRIAFSYNQGGSRRAPIFDQMSPHMACNRETKPPALIAPARAGSKVSFMWSPWYMTHKGPILTYMAPYEGPVDKVDVNALKFFKISEYGLAPDNKTWATDEMISNSNITTATIPHDLKSGNYILRHELISLHYATEDSQYEKKVEKPLGSQHFIQCFNLRVEGLGRAKPEGVVFPGAYRPYREEPGLYFDVWRNVHPYPIPGPPVYIPQGTPPKLEPIVGGLISSPTGNSESDLRYFGALTQDILLWDAFTWNVANSGGKLGYGPNPAMTGPPKGAIPPGAVVDGA